jgi:TolB-like protein/DNA-binding winged helix-turn-helix (wHTH) protein/Flp pilus assembly protein TadD
MDLTAKHFYEFGPFQLDDEKRILWCASEPVALPPKEVETLLVLVRSHGQLVEKEELMKALWPDTFVEEANLAVHISNLRKVLQDQTDAGPCIETVPRRGYRFVANVVEHREASERTPTMGVVESPVTRPGWRAHPLSLTIAALGAVSLLAVGIAFFRRRAQPIIGPPVQIHSIAVLPLQNLSGDSSQEYFVDGLTEMLVTDLAQIHALRVTSRTSVMRYKGTHKPVSEIAQDLNVEGVVEGSVVRSRGRVRITAQLIEAKSDTHLWARTFEGNLQDVLALQSRVAQAIADGVRVRLTPQEQAHLSAIHVTVPEAQEAYLKGRYLLNQRTPESSKKSLKYFQLAVRKDSHYALAHVALAEVYAVLASDDIAEPKGMVIKAKQAAQRALELDGGLGEAYATLAHLEFIYNWDFRNAEQEFRHATELSPNYATAHQWYGLLLLAERRFDEASREFSTALEIDPLSLVSGIDLAQVYFYSGRFDQAVEQTQKFLEINRDFAMAHDLLAMAYEQKGKYPEAIAEFQKYSELTNGSLDARTHLAHAYAVSGKPNQARKILRELEQAPKGGEFLSAYDIASVYAGLGEKEHAFFWLDRAIEERAVMLTFADIDPLLGPLHIDPRFQALIRRIGLPQAR